MAAENYAPSASVSRDQFFFFLVSRFYRVARRNEEECYMHIAYNFRPALQWMHCTAAWAQVATRKECLPSIVGPPWMRVLRAPAL